jgi:GTPase SAR1 family protein
MSASTSTTSERVVSTAAGSGERANTPAACDPVLEALERDFAWLEEYAQKRHVRSDELIRLRLAKALLTNSLRPWLHGDRAGPLQLVVVGGAGAGKSTVANFLIGQAVAETNPQAGYTRHPIAYVARNGPQPRLLVDNRLGRLKLAMDSKPASVDEDVFQIRPVTLQPGVQSALSHAVVWDSPDMTTWQAHYYTARLLEVIGLADLIFYAASDERYNDAIPTQFLRLVLQAGKPVVTVLLKMPADQAASLVDHFRKEVVARIPECPKVAACLAIPYLSPDELLDPAGKAARYRAPLFDQVSWWSERAGATRAQGVTAAANFLENGQEEFLAVARRDLQAIDEWQRLVTQGRSDFVARYEREYLSGEQFPRFNAALLKLLELLELPGIGQIVSRTLWVVRTPYRLVKGLINQVSGTVTAANLPEEPVLRSAFSAWLDAFRKEAAVRAGHPIWEQLKSQFDADLAPRAEAQLTADLADFQAKMTQEVDRTARAIYEDLQKKPAALNTLRGAKFAVEAASIAGTVIMLGAHVMMDIVLVPLVAAFTQELVEILGKQYVDRQREKARQRGRELFEVTLATPLADWLLKWPALSAQAVEQLQGVVQRVPEHLQLLGASVRAEAGGPRP